MSNPRPKHKKEEPVTQKEESAMKNYFITYAEGNFVGPNRPVQSKAVKGENTGDIVSQFRTKTGANIVLLSFEQITDEQYTKLLTTFGANPIA